jgi:DNA-binding PadR family transcriptional regulator
MNLTDNDSLIPLTPQAYHVLLALALHQDTGYGIGLTVAEDTHGLITMASGTLYPLLRRLTQYRYIEAHDPKPGSGPKGIKTVYRLTSNGRFVMDLETNRYRSASQIADARRTHDSRIVHRVQ